MKHVIILSRIATNVMMSLTLGLATSAVLAGIVYLAYSPANVHRDSQPPSAVFVSTVDPLCAAMGEVNRALCSIAVDRPPYGTEESDGAVTWTPDGRALVLDCVGYTGEELSLCLLSAAREPVGLGVLPECPSGELKYATVTCVYLDATDTPTVWRVK